MEPRSFLSDELRVIAFLGWHYAISQSHLHIFHVRNGYRGGRGCAREKISALKGCLPVIIRSVAEWGRSDLQLWSGRGDGLGELRSGLNSASPPSRVPIFLDTRDCVLMNSLNTNEADEDQGPPQGLTQSRMNIYWILCLFFHLLQAPPRFISISRNG